MIRLLLAMLSAFASNGFAAEHADLAKHAVSDARLAEIRGGFELDSGVRASFGIAREVLLNGQVIAQTRFVFHGLEALRSGRLPTIEQFGSAITIVQSGAGNVATLPGLSAASPTSPTTTVALPTTQYTPTTATPTTGALSNTAPVVLTSAPTMGLRESITLGVQNTLNQQLIEMRTTIDATVQSMAALRSQLNASMLRDQLLRR